MNAFLGRWWGKIVLAAVGVLLILYTWGALQAWSDRREDARLRRQADAAAAAQTRDRARVDTARAVRIARDTVYRRDTVRLRQTVTRWRTRVESLPPAPVTHTDTVYVAALGAADSVVRACTQALRTCEQRVAAVRAEADAELRAARTDSAAGSIAARLDERAKADRRERRAKTRRTWALAATLTAGAVLANVFHQD